MYSKAKVGGHPIHPMFVAFPITFYTLSLVAFLVFQFGSREIFWFQLGVFSTYAGVVTALLAAVPGFIDWAFGIPKESAAKKRGLIHMSLNVAALLLFAFNTYQVYGYWNFPMDDVTNLWLVALIGVGLTAAAGYHGWELIATHKVGVSMTPEQERLEPVEKMSRKDHEVASPLTRPRTI
ncbi:MAG TPA: DUF2231 domain-containing protein [Pseudobdellovibrionaceae bacterium]|nr:DUF2231 domain-containing protein [Pseudobdellovibrionaceae bacterium]